MEHERPNPDELLARVAGEEHKQTRGHLKVFFGAAPGVGKTYAMLTAARSKAAERVEVVVGYVETHGRKETEALLAGLEVLPRKRVDHRNATLDEFDLDAALVRRPELILVDELAHTNAPGSRHAKRWQDVLELVESGISVYTTVNVQHLDSLNDVVARVTGVIVRETLPDSVLEQADEIELVDIPVNDLLRRMEEGKVYISDQAQRALQGFFRPGNLIALREMALRRTADRVDAQMRDYRRDHSIQDTWPVKERLMVCIGTSPFSARLIRATSRMAARLNAEWIVAFVETPEYAGRPGEVHNRVLTSLRLAEQLGAETATLAGTHASEVLLRYARSRNVTRIVIGKYGAPLWKRLLRGSILDSLIESSGAIEIYAISGDPNEPPPAPTSLERPSFPWQEYAFCAAMIAACTVLSLGLRSFVAPANLVMVYLVGLVGLAMRCGRKVAILASFVSVAAFDFFCVPPYLTFAVSDSEYILTFAGMLVISLVISTLTVKMRSQAARAVDREAQTQSLYRLSRELAGAPRAFDAAARAAGIARETFAADVDIFLPDVDRISFHRRTAETLAIPSSEEAIAQWVFDHGQRAGRGMDTLPGASALYIPLQAAQKVVGVMAILPKAQNFTFSAEQGHLLEIFASQTALAIERAKSAAAAREAAVRAETEQLRNSLLSAVSHDLRTPLASITGAASSLLEQGERLAPDTRQELMQSIADEAERLSRLVNNLLEMTRLESGTIDLRKDWHPLEEIVGAALHRLESALQGRAVIVDLPADLPLVSVEDVLLEQVFINLLENVLKYTPSGSPIEISAAPSGNQVLIEVRDRGPGFPAGDEGRVFEKFFRGKDLGTRGAGLGLAICQAIVAAHQGTIRAENRPEGGAMIRITLPVGGRPPNVPLDSQPELLDAAETGSSA